LKKRAPKTSQFFCPSAIRPAIGAT
jgi:hypothetical protein